MVCDMVQNSGKERQSQTALCQGMQNPAPQGLEMPPQGKKAITKATKVKKSKKPQRNSQGPAVPEYKLEPGNHYDVYDSHKSIQNTEYTGYETIGHLILYCFLQGTQPYKFSEPAVRRGGKIRESRAVLYES